MKALVLAGGVPQIELLKQLKKRKIETVLADGNPGAVARPFADRFSCVDIFDLDAVTSLCRDEKVDLILTVCADQVLLVVAEVSERLGLPCYLDAQTARNVSDKLLMKSIFMENGIPTSAFVRLNQLTEESLQGLRYPLVVKPVDAYSSKGVRKARGFEELAVYYREAEKISRSGGVIVEEYFDGEEISVDAFVVDGKAKVLTVTNSDKVKDDNRFVIFRGRYPADVSRRVRDRIDVIAQKIADGFGLVNAPLLIQLLVNGDQLTVLEFCARTGGNMKYLLIKYASGVDVIGATIDITLGKAPDLRKKESTYPVVVNDFIYCEPGVFDHFEGVEALLGDGVIREFHPVRSKGTPMKGVFSSSDRIAGVTIVAAAIDEYNAKLSRVRRELKILSADGRDIMRRDLLPALGNSEDVS